MPNPRFPHPSVVLGDDALCMRTIISSVLLLSCVMSHEAEMETETEADTPVVDLRDDAVWQVMCGDSDRTRIICPDGTEMWLDEWLSRLEAEGIAPGCDFLIATTPEAARETTECEIDCHQCPDGAWVCDYRGSCPRTAEGGGGTSPPRRGHPDDRPPEERHEAGDFEDPRRDPPPDR